MQDVPNASNSKKIKELCTAHELSDPFRALFPNRCDFSYVPYGTVRKNCSRIDFFLVSVDVMQNVENCFIKENTQSKLFDHKAITLDFNKSKPPSSRPNITNNIL
jgi:exonuclease III